MQDEATWGRKLHCLMFTIPPQHLDWTIVRWYVVLGPSSRPLSFSFAQHVVAYDLAEYVYGSFYLCHFAQQHKIQWIFLWERLPVNPSGKQHT